jgi:hypothetical protein
MPNKIFNLIAVAIITIFLVSCSTATQTAEEASVKEDEEEQKIDVETQEMQKEEVETIDEDEGEETKGESSEDAPAPEENEVNVDEQVIFNQENIIITLKSLSDSMWGPSLEVLVENNRDEGITVQTRDSAINGVMIESMFSCDVATGKKANDEITFMSSDLEIAQIETIKDIEFLFHIFNNETWDEIYDSDTIYITTSADESYVQSYDDSGFIALDQNDFKIVVKKLDSEDSFWGADIYLYIENNSEKNATIQVRDVSINGFMVEPAFSCDILAGKKAFDSITFLESDLEDNNIENIDELEFYFHIFESDGWDNIFDSELIKVSFSD